MEHVEFVYTIGMTEEEVADRVEAGHTGVLALAEGDDAYAVPISYHYDGERFLLRLSDDDHSQKVTLADTPGEACFVLYDTEDDVEGMASWSIVARGPIEHVDEQFDDAALNAMFPPLRIFDETTGDVEVTVAALEPRVMTARRTVR